MKLLFLLCSLSFVACKAWCQEATKEILPAALAFELAEYQAKRADGTRRLTELAKSQLLTVQQEEMKAGHLETSNAITKAINILPITSPEAATPPDGMSAAAIGVLKDHIGKVFAGIAGLNKLFIPRIEKVKGDLLKAGDLAGANAAEAKLREMKNEADQLSPAKAFGGKQKILDSFTVEALIDGGSELHVTKEGIYWMVPGGEAKPGLHEGSNEATYVNGSRWKPKWRIKGDRGPDTSDVYPIKTTSPKLASETVQVSKERFGKNENRTPVVSSIKDDHFVVTIRDPEGGSRWYKLRIKAIP